jgi:signal transduction histidine kinase
VRDSAARSLRRSNVPERAARHGLGAVLAGLGGRALAADVPQATGTAALGPQPAAMLLAAACAALALVLGVALALRWSRAQRDLTEALRTQRERARCVEAVLDVWLWRSDSEHRVVSLIPPAGAPRPPWADTAAPAPLWEQLSVDDVAGLRLQLQHGRALDDLPVAFAAGGTAGRKGVLRARATSDATGAFAGYVGTLRETTDAAAGAGGAAGAPGPVVSRPLVAAGPSGATSVAESDHESFSFTVSHDLRAPIRVVEGFTKIIKEDYGRALDRVGNDHLDRVLGAAARMNNMIDALLALSKLSSQPLACQPVNLSQLAGYVADDLQRHWPDRDVQLRIEPDMQVLGDPTLLRVVIENLLGNAWKYTAKVGTAQIAFERDPKDAAAYTVSDNGAGFDMRFADRLFGVFQRLHSANDFPGTGVGLASVRRIVRRHGGEIWGEGEVNRGARFHFTLPQGRTAP